MNAQPDFDSLKALLQEEEPLLARLESVLESEYAAFAAREVAGIEQAARDKQGLVAELERLDQARRRWLAGAGLSADREGFEILISGHDRDGELARRWSGLRERIEQCRQFNLRNGRLIEPARRVTEQAVAILLGNDLATQTYDQSGARRPQGSSGRTSIKV